MVEMVAYQYHREIVSEDPTTDMSSVIRLYPRLNELGAQGWDMITIESRTTYMDIGLDKFYLTTYTVYFKRPYRQTIEIPDE